MQAVDSCALIRSNCERRTLGEGTLARKPWRGYGVRSTLLRNNALRVALYRAKVLLVHATSYNVVPQSACIHFGRLLVLPI